MIVLIVLLVAAGITFAMIHFHMHFTINGPSSPSRVVELLVLAVSGIPRITRRIAARSVPSINDDEIAGFFARSRLRLRDPEATFHDGYRKSTARAVQREKTIGRDHRFSRSADKGRPHRLRREIRKRTPGPKKHERSRTAGSVQENDVVLGVPPRSAASAISSPCRRSHKPATVQRPENATSSAQRSRAAVRQLTS